MPRLVAGGRIKALFSEEGELICLELDGKRYEGVGDSAPIPLSQLKNLKLGEIPEDVFIEPVKSIEGNVVYGLELGELFSYTTRFSRNLAEVEVFSWTAEWDDVVGPRAYLRALTSIVKELEKAGLVESHYVEKEEKWFTLTFLLKVPEGLTVPRAVKLIKKIAQEVEAEVEYRATRLALKELRKRMRMMGKPEETFSTRFKKIYADVNG
ncbi:MAG: hypothetical protein NZ954_07725 [Thermofilaceae archaeon]|nr:hypothetical protein [Thermofilaceae archaeon]MDW8004709.1 hypothetical protein [Thermofilaceae archaeon]